MIADIVLVLIMALCVFLGYKRGLIGVAVKLLGFIIALVIALILYTPISNYIIENTEAVSSIQTMIQDKISSGETSENGENTGDNTFIAEMEKYIKNNTEEIKTNSSEYISREIAVLVIRGLTWFGLFIAVRIIMIVLRLLAKVIGEIPIIKQFNKARRNNLWNS